MEAAGRNGSGETVLFVDQTVTDWQALVAGVKPGVDVIVLNPNQDGITQVTQALAGLSDVKAIEFLTDGTPGSITLGSTTLDAATLAARASEITGWSNHLASNAAVVFWGCDVGEGSVGQAFIADVHTLTGATVAASSDAVGSAALGGSWTLNVTSGPLYRDVNPFTAAALASYTGILDTPNPTVTLNLAPGIANSSSGTVLLGDTLTATVTFENAAANATGYGPYVELFVPTGLTISGSPKYGTSSLTDLSATVTGGAVTNPLTHASESAPSGFSAGTLYVIELPYGSFTPGEPAISLTATFQMASTPTLVGTSLTIDARGGFEYGAVATGAPNIEGTSVSSSDTVELIESYATVTTSYGEDETATGPDFPVQYVVHLITAPGVTSGDPIDNLSLALQLPNDVVWTGTALAATGGGTASVSSAAADGGTVQTVNVDFATLSGTQTITIPVYVPQNYQYTANGATVGTPILDPSTGAPVEITINPPYDYSANAWNSISLPSETGNVSEASFEAKSLAVQLTANTSSAVPGQDIDYTMHFEVSDYFGIGGLTLNALMSNGLTFDPTVTPTLTVTAAHGGVGGTSSFTLTSSNTGTFNGETVQTSGGGANWSYTFASTAATTAVSFNVGAQLSGLYGAGTVGSLTFAGTILEKYPNAIDNVTNAGGFLRETDTVDTSSSSNPAADLYDYQGGTSYSASVGSISDNTATPVDTLPAGSLTLTVAYVDGVAYTGQEIEPGDTVVYQLVYTLPEGGNFADLSMSAYLPEPVFSALFPSNPDQTTTADFAGTGTSTFAEQSVAASALTSGNYTYTLSSGLASDGVTVTGGTGSEPTNSVAFTAAAPGGQPYFNSGNQTSQTITIDLAVTASSEPFVSGLHLTAQGNSSFTPALSPTFTRQTTATVTMGEPLLAIDQGVVSIVDDNGTVLDSATGVTWSGAASSAPTALFAAAGSSSVFAAGATIPAALVAADDHLSVAGAQAGDTVRIVDTVQNTGAEAAYDVILKDALAQGLSTANVSNLTFTLGNGTVLEVLNPATGTVLTGTAAIDAFFSGTGVVLTIGGSTGTAVLAASGTTGDIVYVTYDVTLPNNTPTAGSLTGMASIVAWTNHDVYTATGTGYTLTDSDGNDANFADDTALGATLTSTATVATLAPTVTDDIAGGTDASDASASVPTNTYPTNAATAVPGETVDLAATITLPQGQSTSVSFADIIPAGLTPVTTAGSYTVTLNPNDGSAPVTLTADATWTGQTLTVTIPTVQVNPHTGGDQAATVVVDYQALVPQTQATAINTSSWTSATFGDVARKDPFDIGTEGVKYGTTVATSTATTTGTSAKVGVANDITVTNPLVTSTLTELGGTSGQTVYSEESITYQITLSNTSTSAWAYDTGATIALPAGLTYVAGSLTETSGGAGTLSTGNIGSNGSSPGGNALGGFTLAPGATDVFTFQATVNKNLAAGTTLKVTSQPVWNSLPASATFDGAGNVNSQAQAYTGAQGAVQNSVATFAPMLSMVGSSNDTAGLGTAGNGTLFDPNGETSPTAVLTTDGEIVRMRTTLQVPEGLNNNVTMTVTLPAGLTLDPSYATDGSVTVLLVSPNGDFTTTLTGTGLQLAEGATAVNTAKLDLGTGSDTTDPVVATLPPGAISVVGQTVTFNLGTLSNNDGSALPNYAIVEFNAVVGTVAGGTTLAPTTMQGSANGVTTATVDDYVKVEAPVVSLAKQITGITYNSNGSATVSYVDTITNNGDGPAYGLTLTDPGADVGSATPGTIPSGSGVGASIGVDGTGIQATLTSLPGSGGAQSFTYSVTIPANKVDQAVSDAASTASVVSAALNPVQEVGGKEVLAGTSLTPATSTATASAGLDLVSGTVNQDVSASEGSDTSLVPLAGQTVSVTFTGQTGTESMLTASDGSYAVLVPDTATTVTISANASGPNAPANDVLDNHPNLTTSLTGTSPSTTGSNPATLSFTPALDTSYTGIPFDFWHALDTAPVLANGPSSATGYEIGTAPILLFPAGTVSDAQLDGSFGHDFSGTTLTIQRYVTGAATPTSGDVFAGSGTATTGLYLNTSNGQVLYNGSQIGSFTETGGKLTIAFAASGVTDTTVAEVLQNLTYSYTGGYNPLTATAVIGAQIDDANNDPIGLNGFAPDSSGPHDQGPGGDLLSNVLTATVDISAPSAVPTLAVVGGSNDTAGLGTAGNGTLFDPNGETSPTAVLTTDGEIVRMRASLQLSEGSNGDVTMTVTLPAGLTLDPNYATDGSITVLLVSPNGDFTTTLTGTGLQLAEHTTAVNTAKLDLGTGGDTTDPVVATLPAGAISVVGQTVTFNLGTLSNNDGSALPNYAIVEFNAVVGTTVPGGTAFTSSMQASANSTTTATVNDYVTVEAPNVSLAKQITGITYNSNGSATVTYLDTITNNGDGPAYGLTLTDPGAGVGSATPGSTPSGSGVGASIGVDGTGIQATLTSLPGSGGAQSFTYTVTIPANQVNQAVSDAASTASVTSGPLNPAHETGGLETLTGTSVTPPVKTATASAGLDLVSGTVNQDVSGTEGTDTPLVPLAGQTVSVTFPGQSGTETLQTGTNGNYAVLVPDSATTVTVTANASGPNAPVNDVLDNHPALVTPLNGTAAGTTGSNPVVLTFTPAANTSYTGIPFDFWHSLDTAPVLANGPTGPTTFTIAGTPLLIFPAATVSDAELDGSFGHDFSGTTLVIQRYVSGAATPTSGDVFTGSGTPATGLYLNTSNDQLLYNGSQVGTFTETGGKLTIHFAATGVSDITVDNVLQHLAYSFSGATNTPANTAVIGAQIDDANNDPIGLSGFAPDPSGPHDQGPGGDLPSNVLTATLNIVPLPSPAPPAPPPGLNAENPTPFNVNDPNFGYSNDLVGREIIPELSLVGSEADHFIIVDQHAVIAVPPNIFVDSVPDEPLSFEAKRPDGSPLPSWLSFDPTSLTFYGTPPESAVGRVEIVIIASDSRNNTADATFTILVGHQQSDLIGLISGRRPGGFSLTPGDIRNLQFGDAQPVPNHTRLVDTAHAQHDASARAAMIAPMKMMGPVAERGGFSGALRGAGPMGSLTRARALLDALENLTRSQPAA